MRTETAKIPTLAEIFSTENMTPTGNRNAITNYLTTATGETATTNETEIFIELLRHKYGAFPVAVTMPPALPSELYPVTPENFVTFFHERFGYGYSMRGVRDTIDTALKYADNQTTETRTGDRDKTGEKTETTENGGKVTTTNTGTSATGTTGDLTVTNTGTTSAANSGNVTTQNTGTDEKSLGAWNATDYQGAEKVTNTGSDTTTDTRTTTTTNNLSEVTRDGRTVTRTDNLTNEQTDTRSQDKTSESTDTETYNETVSRSGGNPAAANYYFDSQKSLNFAELFCAEFVKRFCITVW